MRSVYFANPEYMDDRECSFMADSISKFREREEKGGLPDGYSCGLTIGYTIGKSYLVAWEVLSDAFRNASMSDTYRGEL